MVIRGHFQNGVVIPDEPVNVPEGTTVRIEVIKSDQHQTSPRVGGMWKGQVVIADDFDVLPADLRMRLGSASNEIAP